MFLPVFKLTPHTDVCVSQKKMTMKKIMIGAVVLMLAAGTVQAQDNRQIPKKHHRNQDGKMFEKLNFTQDQKSQMKSINDDFRKHMQELRKNEDITVKEWKARNETLRKNHREQVQNLLTNDQKAQLAKIKQERKTKHEAYSKARMEKMTGGIWVRPKTEGKIEDFPRDLECLKKSDYPFNES